MTLRLPCHIRVLLLGAMGVAFSHNTPAQRAETDLIKLRAEHEKALASASRLIDDIHRLTLRQLERERAEAGDYETAAQVKDRLANLEEAPGTAAIVPPPVTHTLTAGRALTRDGANSEGGREYIDFRKTGGKAVWDILGLEKGSYEIYLTYSVGLPRFDDSSLGEGASGQRVAPGGVISFSEVTGLTSGTPATLEKRVQTTGAWENYIRESIGRYEFRNATTTVRLEAVTASEGGLLRLRQVDLVKVVAAPESPATAAAGSEPSRQLQELQTKHRASLRQISQSLRPRFADEFLKLEQSFTAAGDTAAASAVARSRKQLFPEGRTDGHEDDADPSANGAASSETKKP